MAQPRDYTRQFNFNDFQATSPADPLPGVRVDAELNAVKLTLDDLNTNIAKIQRDDGKLGNQAVHKDAFDPGALALINATGFTPRGDWATATTYAVGDIVDFNSGTYLATTAHTSSAAFATDNTANYWILIANAAISGTSSAVDKFEGDGTTTVFTLTYSYASTTSIQVFVNGELLNPTDDYTLSGNQLTLFTAPGLPTVSGNENVIVWGASVVGQAAANAASASASNASGFADEADNWARKTNGLVESTDYSSKAYAVGGTGVDNGAGSAKDWATKTTSTVGNTSEYSAKYWATQGDVPIVAGGIANITTVAGQISPTNNIGTLAGINAAISTVSGISSDVTTVSGISAAVSTVAADGVDIGVVSGISADVQTLAHLQDGTTATNALSTLAGISSDISTVSSANANLTTVATNIASVNTVSSNITHVVKVAQDLNEAISEVETVANDLNETTSEIEVVANAIANVNTVGSNIASVNTVSGISADVTAVASIQSNISTIAASAATTNINTVAADLNGSNTIGTVAGQITNVQNVGGSITSVNTVANNLTSVNQFANQYVIGNTTPSSPNAGLLWFDTTTGVDTMKVYNGTSFQNAGSSVNGTSESVDYVVGTSSGSYNGSTTVFPATYDPGFLSVYLNGVRLHPSDFTATNGTSVTLGSAASANDIVSIEAFGTFVLADHYSKTQADARYAVLGADVDFGSNKILYSNVYSTPSDFPSASTYHGMVAHSHSNGKLAYAHAGNWLNVVNEDTSGNVTISGNLVVSGTTTTVNSTTLDVADKNITIANGAADAAAADGAGLTVDGASATILYTASGDKWAFNKPIGLGGWTITESGGSLYFATGGTNKMKLDANGNLDVVGSVNSNATIS